MSNFMRLQWVWVKGLTVAIALSLFSLGALAGQTTVKSIVINYQDAPDAATVAKQGLPAASALRLNSNEIQGINSKDPAAIKSINKCPRSGASTTLISKNGQLFCGNGKSLNVMTSDFVMSSKVVCNREGC